MRWVLLLLVLPGAAAQAVVVAVVPDLSVAAPGDEGFALAPTDGPVELRGWTVTDGEGTWPLPPMVLDRETWFVGDAAAWVQRDGPTPAAEFGTTLRLANGGDEVILRDPTGREVDSMAYGGTLAFAGADMMWRRLPADAAPGTLGGASGQSPRAWIDTDSVDDWRTPRIHRVGESNLEMPRLEVDALTAYASPDSTFHVLTELMRGATQRLHLHVYELRSQELAAELAAAAQRGVDVQVLVTARPVGQEPNERHQTAHALASIERAGGQAFLAEGGRYRYHHLKVLVADDAVAVQSENWVASGVPADPSWGNRGWGAVLHDAEAAAWFAGWMAADRGAWDAVPFDMATYDPLHESPPRFATPTGQYRGDVPAVRFQGPILLMPVITPDATHDPRFDPTFAAAAEARHRLWAQQLDFTTRWSNDIGWSGPDGLREALRDAGRRGVDARVMAAGPFRLTDTGNADAMAALPADNVATCTFALPDLVLHNKGLIADDMVYVGSMNGNQHSRSMNREAGVLIDDARVADYFAALFESDWTGCDASSWDQQVPALGPTLFAALLVMATRCCRPFRLPHSPSSQAR